MKKYLFLSVFAFVVATFQAQNVSYVPYHYIGCEYFTIENMMQQRDGDIVTCIYVADPNIVPMSLGDIVYKMSPNTLQFTDSLFIADTVPPYYLFAKDQCSEGNIRANFEYHEDCDSTFLRICHFPDNDLQVNHDMDVVVPLCDGAVLDYIDSYMVDSQGDLIVKYYKELSEGGFVCHIARFDCDGTLKHEALLPESQNFIRNMGVLSESPLKYYQWKCTMESNLTCYVIDSLFELKSSSVFNKILHEEHIGIGATVRDYFNFDGHTRVIPDGEDILIAAKYTNDTNYDPLTGEHGIAVARYNLRTMQRKNLIMFNDYPGAYEAMCDGFQKMSDGAIYLLYTELDTLQEQKTFAVKMDSDFNVEWKRYCQISEKVGLFSTAYCIPAKDEEGNEVMAISGDSYDFLNGQLGIFYFFLTHDGTVSVNESGIQVRPYCFYPNPVQARLQMQFSPDVQPKQIELYDLQGRMVRVQRSSFGSIDMSRLPAGAYMLRVTLEDGTVYSDKVVKE